MPPKKKAKKDEQIKDVNIASEVILQYMKSQFRPYSVNDIVLNLHNKIGKTCAVKALNELSEKNQLYTKTFGKMSFYVYKMPEDDKEEAVTDDKKPITMDLLGELNEESVVLGNEVKDLKNEIKQITSEPSNDELVETVQKLTDEVEELKVKCEKIEEETVAVKIDESKIDQINNLTNEYESICKTRKKHYVSIVAVLKENITSYKDLLEKAGVED